MTTTRRSLLKSFVAMLCGLLFRKTIEGQPVAAIICQAPYGGPPIKYIVSADSPSEAINHTDLPKLGDEWPMQNLRLVLASKDACRLYSRSPRDWQVTCEWKILDNDGLTTESDGIS